MQYNRQKIKSTVKLLLTLLLLATVVVAIRYFLVESYRISTSTMANTLKEGDLIVVNKFSKLPERNQVILFTSPLRKDTTTSPLFISRCIGLPGDTIRVNGDGYTINGRFFPLSPNAICQYRLDNSAADLFVKTLNKLKIPIRNLQNERSSFLISLTPFEEYSIREELPETINQTFIKLTPQEYSLIVPRKDRAYRLTDECLIACKEAISREAESPVSFRDDKLYLDGKETDFFFFEQDYFWVLSDNMNEGIDSRHLGFIPEESIVGTAWYCWFSPQTKRFFNPVN
ncbi:signal peptidase I [Massilibacteroides vaginae]|uniref:signal peptidase I n=1 Tax=Massilibacteroides vaginae TaxID=1673718 RepID=UPI000A1CE4E1|nr:signal peptidase I [Massilibacteroides vaginae]